MQKDFSLLLTPHTYFLFFITIIPLQKKTGFPSIMYLGNGIVWWPSVLYILSSFLRNCLLVLGNCKTCDVLGGTMAVNAKPVFSDLFIRNHLHKILINSQSVSICKRRHLCVSVCNTFLSLDQYGKKNKTWCSTSQQKNWSSFSDFGWNRYFLTE